MKTTILFLFIILALTSCDKKPVNTKYCQNCDLKTDGLLVVENRQGFMVFLPDYGSYGIELPSFDNKIIFIPCKMPSYFHPVEMGSVEFSGTIIEDPYKTGDIIKTTFYCIKLDTIHTITPK